MEMAVVSTENSVDREWDWEGDMRWLLIGIDKNRKKRKYDRNWSGGHVTLSHCHTPQPQQPSTRAKDHPRLIASNPSIPHGP